VTLSAIADFKAGTQNMEGTSTEVEDVVALLNEKQDAICVDVDQQHAWRCQCPLRHASTGTDNLRA